MKRLSGAETKLEKAVQRIVNRQAKDYGSVEAWLADLRQGGCASGMVTEMIYYTDTVRFFKRHEQEITALLANLLSDVGSSPKELFCSGWDEDDPSARETHNQNTLAWFAFEQTAFDLASRNGIEV